MTQLYPLLMSPAFDPRPWGTLDLSAIYPNHKFNESIGEAWLTGDNCVVVNGPLAKRTLADLSKELGAELVGTAARDPQRFPLLLKFLFPEEKLSVQVHPDDVTAQQFGEPWGKTECWYVAHAKAGSQIALGLKPGVTRAQFAQSIQEKRAEELLQLDQRLSGRNDLCGRGYRAHARTGIGHRGDAAAVRHHVSSLRLRTPAPLHLERGLASVKEHTASGKVIRPAPASIDGGNSRFSSMIRAPYFKVDLFELKEPHVFSTAADGGKTSVQILVAVEGCGVVEAQGRDPVTLAKGDAVVIPAVVESFMVRPQWAVEFLIASLPGGLVPEPATRM